MNCLRTPRFAAALAMVAVAGVTLSACLGAQAEADVPQSFNGATATVTRGDLVGRATVQGSLHYADSYTLKSTFEGVVIALLTPGTTLTQGSHVYAVAGNNTCLFHGSTPTWCAFEEGMSDDEDATQLKTTLLELGYFKATPNAHFNWNTIAMIKRWQKALSLPQGSSLPPDTVPLTSEGLHIGALKARVGTSVTMETELFIVLSSRRVISTNLKLPDQVLGVVGNFVTVCPPGSATTTTETITSVEPPHERESEESSKETNKERIISVITTPDDTPTLEGFQEVFISLGLTSKICKGVLPVPSGALAALGTDQFGVEVVDKKGEIRRIPVTVGLFADDRVEVGGDKTAEGQRMAMPSR